MKKYKLQKYVLTAFGYSKKRGKYPVDLTYCGRKCVSQTEIKKKLTSFFLRNDVSRMMTGRKHTVTRLKTKMQKRLLTDTMRNLHTFLSNNLGQISYTFCRLKPPLWVVTPSSSDRDTHLCKKHENLQFMANALQDCCLQEILKKCLKQPCATPKPRHVLMVGASTLVAQC